VEFAIDSLSISIDQLESVGTITIHEAISIRKTTITKEEADLMSCFWSQTDEIPEHVRILI
jgi:hypothetical protein